MSRNNNHNNTKGAPLICGGHSRPVPFLQYSNITDDGVFIISACLDGKPILRNGDTGDWIGTFQGHKGAVWCARLNAAATQAVTGSADYTAKLWDALSGNALQTFNHSKIVKAVDFINNDSHILTGGVEKQLKIFSFDKPDAPVQVLNGHTDTIKFVQTAPAGAPYSFISGGADSSIRVWDTRSNSEVRNIITAGPVMSVDLTPDMSYLIATFGKTVAFYDAKTFEPLKQFKFAYDVNSAALSPDKTHFTAGGTDFWVHLYEFDSGKELEVHRGHHGPVHCVRWNPYGTAYASGSEDGTIRIWQSIVQNNSPSPDGTADGTTGNTSSANNTNTTSV